MEKHDTQRRLANMHEKLDELKKFIEENPQPEEFKNRFYDLPQELQDLIKEKRSKTRKATAHTLRNEIYESILNEIKNYIDKKNINISSETIDEPTEFAEQPRRNKRSRANRDPLLYNPSSGGKKKSKRRKSKKRKQTKKRRAGMRSNNPRSWSISESDRVYRDIHQQEGNSPEEGKYESNSPIWTNELERDLKKQLDLAIEIFVSSTDGSTNQKNAKVIINNFTKNADTKTLDNIADKIHKARAKFNKQQGEKKLVRSSSTPLMRNSFAKGKKKTRRRGRKTRGRK